MLDALRIAIEFQLAEAAVFHAGELSDFDIYLDFGYEVEHVLLRLDLVTFDHLAQPHQGLLVAFEGLLVLLAFEEGVATLF